MPVTSHFSLVLEVLPAEPQEASQHFASKLSFETDPSDVMLDLKRGQNSFIIVDVRNAEDFDECHIEGAISFPYRQMNAETLTRFSKDKLIVVYCWGPGCNASTKAAFRLSALGFHVKEMIGGLEYWKKEGGGLTGKNVFTG
jgi:rhodanese-related sulfurtransferase